jgi:hypothetical protein
MKSTALLMLLNCGWLIAPALAGQAPGQSRFGELEVKNEENSLIHRLLLNGKEIYAYEGYSIEVAQVLRGKARDYVLVAAYSGGSACPAQYVILEIDGRLGLRNSSEEFGSCSDLPTARLASERVTVEMPLYAPHPDLRTQRKLRSLGQAKEVFTWYQGKLSSRTVALGKRR